MYVPPSSKFHLTVNARVKSTNFKAKIMIKKLDFAFDEELTQEHLQDSFKTVD